MDYRSVRSDLGTVDDLRALTTDAARAGHQPVPRPRAQPRGPRARVGGRRAGRATRRSAPTSTCTPTARCRTPTRPACPRCSPTSRPATSPGTTSSAAGSGRRSTTTSGTSTGRTRRCCASTPTSSSTLANLGVEVFRLDAIAFIWKRMGTACQNQPEVHDLTQALRTVARMACPAVLFKAEAIVGPADLPAYLGVGRARAARSATSPTTTV